MMTFIPDEGEAILIEYRSEDDLVDIKKVKGYLVQRQNDLLVVHDRSVGQLRRAARVDLDTATVTVYVNAHTQDTETLSRELHDIRQPPSASQE